MTDKTEETQDYFNNNIEFWRSLFSDSLYGTATQRVTLVAKKMHKLIEYQTSKLPEYGFTHLDFGCGTGELASISASMGAKVIAVDVAPAMVEATWTKIDKAYADKSKVFQGDVNTLEEMEAKSIDVFSALGLIEYLTVNELELFLQQVGRTLRQNGKAYIGSRNRLFNIFSDNQFTDIEKTIGEFDKLSAEYTAVSQWICENALIQSLNDKAKIAPFLNWKYPDSLPKTSPISVSQRIQYSVCDLSMRLMNHGLKITDIMAVRYHPAKPAILDPNNNVDLIDKINMAMDEYASSAWAIPSSSTYILEIAKE